MSPRTRKLSRTPSSPNSAATSPTSAGAKINSPVNAIATGTAPIWPRSPDRAVKASGGNTAVIARPTTAKRASRSIAGAGAIRVGAAAGSIAVGAGIVPGIALRIRSMATPFFLC